MWIDRTPVVVFGPAYLDRVVRVDRPLVDPAFVGPSLDGSVDGAWMVEGGAGLTLVDPLGSRIEVEVPGRWRGPSGTIRVSRPFTGAASGWSRTVLAGPCVDDLGGMGAGFAASLGGELVSALGPEADPTSQAIRAALGRAGIRHLPIRVPEHPADWTLLLTSGEHGDKLPIGFRGCHAALPNLDPWAARPCQVRVVAALPNRLASDALGRPAPLRMFAPNLRNMLDRDPPLASFAASIDVLCCNRGEWDQLPDRDEVAREVPVLAITDGPRGAEVRYTTPRGEAERVAVLPFPRSRPIVDTNRAGEAFASALLATLLEADWEPGVAPAPLIRQAANRASAAAALTIGLAGFAFPGRAEVEAAVRAGRVE